MFAVLEIYTRLIRNQAVFRNCASAGGEAGMSFGWQGHEEQAAGNAHRIEIIL